MIDFCCQIINFTNIFVTILCSSSIEIGHCGWASVFTYKINFCNSFPFSKVQIYLLWIRLLFMYIMYMFRNVFDFMVFNSACFIDKFIENPNIFLTDHSKRFFSHCITLFLSNSLILLVFLGELSSFVSFLFCSFFFLTFTILGAVFTSGCFQQNAIWVKLGKNGHLFRRLDLT